MFRPWSQDPRPVWYVKATWRTVQSTGEDDRERLLQTLNDTGHIRAPALEVGADRLTLSMLVHASDRNDAEHAAVRVAEVAYQTAGLGDLGMHIACAAHCASRDDGAGTDVRVDHWAGFSADFPMDDLAVDHWPTGK